MAKNRFDINIFDKFEKEQKANRKHQPVVMLAGKKGKPFLVQYSTDAEPACWSIVGKLFDTTFLSRKDLEDFIIQNNLHEWTEEDDKKYQRNFSNYCKNTFRIEL